ncbi:MAG: hypothetical protein WBE97_10555 [Candidatus Acidiferrales bacterium]
MKKRTKKVSQSSIQVVTKYGTMWRRNSKNIARLPTSKQDGGKGVYILFDGSMPVYVGKGNIKQRVSSARRGRRKQFWDRFSWYALKDQRTMHDIEVLVLRMLPRYFRALTENNGYFVDAKRIKVKPKDRIADYITRKIK